MSKKDINYEDMVFESREKVDEVWRSLTNLLDNYEEVTVADFNDLVGVEVKIGDNQYGWNGIVTSKVEKIKGGYILKLPKPKSFLDKEEKAPKRNDALDSLTYMLTAEDYEGQGWKSKVIQTSMNYKKKSCTVCGADFIPLAENHYISRDSKPALFAESKEYDTYDCVQCNSQIVVGVRKIMKTYKEV